MGEILPLPGICLSKMKLYAQITNGRILPEYNNDYDKLKKLRSGETYLVEIKQPRNIGFHRKYYALMNLAFDNQDHFDNLESMRKWLQMKAGYYTETITPTGVMFEPKSISFASMDELEFNELYQRVMDQVCWFLDTTQEDILENIVNFM